MAVMRRWQFVHSCHAFMWVLTCNMLVDVRHGGRCIHMGRCTLYNMLVDVQYVGRCTTCVIYSYSTSGNILAVMMTTWWAEWTKAEDCKQITFTPLQL